MEYEIKNQYGKHLLGNRLRDEIIYAADHGMNYTYFEDSKIDIVSQKKTEKKHLIVVDIKGI